MNADRMKELMTRIALPVDSFSDFKNMGYVTINQDLAKLMLRNSAIGNYAFLHLSYRDEGDDGQPIYRSVRLAPIDTWDIIPGMVYCVPTQKIEGIKQFRQPETKHVFIYREFGNYHTCRMYIWNGKDA